MGASFDHGEDGNLHLAREGGHSHHRIVHASDMTGREIERALLKAVFENPNISMFEHHFAIDFLTSQVSLLSWLVLFWIFSFYTDLSLFNNFLITLNVISAIQLLNFGL